MATETEQHTVKRIVVGADGSASAHNALVWAVAEARLRGAQLEVVHAWHYPSSYASAGGLMPMYDLGDLEVAAKTELDRIVGDVDTSELAAPIKQTLVSGTAANALINAGAGADLLVLGSRGHGGFAGLLLGSVSQQVAHHAPCPVVIVP